MKKFIALLAFASTSLIVNAGFSTGQNPNPWSPWYLYQSNAGKYQIECVYKRERLGPNGGYKDVETQRLWTARYPFGKCPDTI